MRHLSPAKLAVVSGPHYCFRRGSHTGRAGDRAPTTGHVSGAYRGGQDRSNRPSQPHKADRGVDGQVVARPLRAGNLNLPRCVGRDGEGRAGQPLVLFLRPCALLADLSYLTPPSFFCSTTALIILLFLFLPCSVANAWHSVALILTICSLNNMLPLRVMENGRLLSLSQRDTPGLR